MSSTKLRIGYVPEHFSSPLLLLAAHDPSIELVSCPSGTGQVMKAFNDGQIDLAIALTEALIAGIAKQTAQFKIVGTYVSSPLNWAVIVGKDAQFESLADLRGLPIGISRIGSGSQVMASYMALKEGWLDEEGKVEKLDFKVLDTFKALRDGTNDGTTGCFMWEHFTTKPYMLSGEVKFLDHVPTPWSSWKIVSAPHVDKSALKSFLGRLTEDVHAFDRPEARASTSQAFLEKEFGYPKEDVTAWLEQVAYPKVGLEVVERSTVEKTLSTLEAAGVLEKREWDLEDFVDTEVATLQ